MPNDSLLVQGSTIWCTWTALSLIQIGSDRYFQNKIWQYRRSLKLSASSLQIAMALYIANDRRFQLFWMNHGSIAHILIFLIAFHALVGLIISCFLQSEKPRCRPKCALQTKHFHCLVGFSLAIIGQVLLYNGVQDYRVMYTRRVNKMRFYCMEDVKCPQAPSEFPLEKAFFGFFVITVVGLEMLRRFRRGKDVKIQ